MLPVVLALSGCETLDTPNPIQRYFPRCRRHQLSSSWPIALGMLGVCYALSSTLCAHRYTEPWSPSFPQLPLLLKENNNTNLQES